jgi:hypothetical protein
MYCQKCGAENLENARMCERCGGVFVFSKPARVSGLAVTSMILGISGFTVLGLFGITWIIGLVFGILSLGRINKSGGQLKGRGFAITGTTTSAAGLVILLTIITLWTFVTSAQTISIKRKVLSLQNNIGITEPKGSPTIEGWVYILEDKSRQDYCKGTLFNTVEPAKNISAVVTYGMTCGEAEKEPIKANWQFIRAKDEGDEYRFTITVPVNENATQSISKMVVYDGTEQIIFGDQTRKILIHPAEE